MEYLDAHKNSSDLKISDITQETGVSAYDIVTALQLLGFLRSETDSDGQRKVVMAVDWSKVSAHMAKVKKSLRIKLDPDCLRWIPLLAQIPIADESGDTGSECSPAVLEAPKPVPTVVEKIQRVKIKKRTKGRRAANRRGAPAKNKTPVKKVEEPKVEEEVVVSTPKSSKVKAKTPVLSPTLKRKVRTTKVEPPITPRKRKHSEKTEPEELVEVRPKKRTRESAREKEQKELKEQKEQKEQKKIDRAKEKMEWENEIEKERELAKESSSPVVQKPKRQSKLDDILTKVTNRQTKSLPKKDKKIVEETVNSCNGKEEVEKSKTPSRRRGKSAAVEKTVEKVKEKDSTVQPTKQLTIPEMIEKNAKLQEESVDDDRPANTFEVPSTSPGEYEGGDEDEGEEEEEEEEEDRQEVVSSKFKEKEKDKKEEEKPRQEEPKEETKLEKSYSKVCSKVFNLWKLFFSSMNFKFTIVCYFLATD